MLPQELLNTVAEIASKTAIMFYKEEKKKEEKKRKTDKIDDAKKLLVNYRILKKKVEEEGEFTDYEKAEKRWKFVEDLIGNSNDFAEKSERIVNNEEKRRQKDLYDLWRIENAIRMYKEECELSCKDDDMRRFNEMYDMYISEDRLSVADIAERENISEKTVYRDLGIAYRMLSVFLYGI